LASYSRGIETTLLLPTRRTFTIFMRLSIYVDVRLALRLDRSASVDTFTSVDMKGEAMFRLFKTTKAVAVEFCERCSQVCDAGCRAAALRERARMQALQFGGRI
jgi:hypothetical protein